jgi:predicted lipid carrier protein YhbT
VAVPQIVVLSGYEVVDRALVASASSRTINQSFVERQHATKRDPDTRKSRWADRSSKDWHVQEVMTYSMLYRDNFC